MNMNVPKDHTFDYLGLTLQATLHRKIEFDVVSNSPTEELIYTLLDYDVTKNKNMDKFILYRKRGNKTHIKKLMSWMLRKQVLLKQQEYFYILILMDFIQLLKIIKRGEELMWLKFCM